MWWMNVFWHIGEKATNRCFFLFLNFAPGVFIYSLMYSRKNIVFLPCLTCVWICTKLWERCFGDNNSRDDITHLRLCHSLLWWPWLSDSRWRLWTTTYMGNQNDHSSVPVRLDPFSFVARTAQRRWQSCRNPTHTRVTGFRVFLLFFFWRLKLVGGGMMTDNATQCRVCVSPGNDIGNLWRYIAWNYGRKKQIFEKDIWKSDKRPILIHHSNV